LRAASGETSCDLTANTRRGILARRDQLAFEKRIPSQRFACEPDGVATNACMRIGEGAL